MEILEIIPENVQDVTLGELQNYNLLLARQFTNYSREAFRVKRRKAILGIERQRLLFLVTREVYRAQLTITKTADRLSPRERAATIQALTAERFPHQEEYDSHCVEEVTLAEVKAHLDFQAERLKQATMAAATRKKYGGTIT